MTTNSINYNKHLEDKRSNQAREIETNRSNLAQEAETKRHNIATEDITERNLQELVRHNMSSENLTSQQLKNALAIAQIGAGATISAANISAAASKYASDNNFVSSMAGVQQRQEAAEIGALATRYSADKSASSRLQSASLTGSWNAYNVTRQIAANERIATADREQRNKENIRNNLTQFINGQSNAATNLVGSTLKFIPIGG